MSRQTEFQGVSTRASRLLKQQEGSAIEFKEAAKAVDDSDLVAFANSEYGGTILVGVKEEKTDHGRQKTQIVGCLISDEEKQRLVGKAASCHPSIAIDIFVENLNSKPFFRIEIPSGQHKPYCTGGGRYSIRDDGQTKALTPPMLLNMFMAAEGEEFISRFKSATDELAGDLTELKGKVNKELEELLSAVATMGQDVHGQLERIFRSAQSAESLADEAVSYSDETSVGIGMLDKKLEKLRQNTKSLDTKVSTLRKELREYKQKTTSA